MSAPLRRFLIEDEGVTLIEYGLLAGLIAVVAVAGVRSLRASVGDLFDNVATTLQSAIPP